jgi:hypothetical protein
MILPAAFLLGFAAGWLRARRAGGNRADRMYYGAAHGIALSLAALIVLLALDWAGLV